jgi:hypothetical protein
VRWQIWLFSALTGAYGTRFCPAVLEILEELE